MLFLYQDNLIIHFIGRLGCLSKKTSNLPIRLSHIIRIFNIVTIIRIVVLNMTPDNDLNA
jgi:hypothetical protein